ncbi:putative RNA-directed DNA polymerase from transposon X-element [Trichonephila clavipes]|nr:putative RNA-directed DNA polymerase from transposon X-element [Trichonephila clavipes]
MQPFPRTSILLESCVQTWWNATCQQAKKEQRRAWGIFGRYPTTDNLIAFKRAALARNTSSMPERILDPVCVFNHIVNYQSTVMERSKQRMAFIGIFNIPILKLFYCFLYSSPLDVANLIGKTFASVSSSDSYSPAFQATKNRLERTPINFSGADNLYHIL